MPSERFTVSMTTPGTVDGGTFPHQFTDFLDGAGTAYFDSVGNPIRIVIHWDHHSSDTNSVTGLTLHEHGHYSKRIDFLTGITLRKSTAASGTSPWTPPAWSWTW
jgi:hypothetical protein